MERHSRSFFGQKVGMILDSGSWEHECIYLTFLRKLQDGTWEKPTKGQGKKIKLNLGEQILLSKVLVGSSNEWKTVHKFNEQTTSISIKRDENEHVWISVDAYHKRIVTPETDVLRMMMEHVIQEKIEHSTGQNTEKSEPSPPPMVLSKAQLEAVVSE